MRNYLRLLTQYIQAHETRQENNNIARQQRSITLILNIKNEVKNEAIVGGVFHKSAGGVKLCTKGRIFIKIQSIIEIETAMKVTIENQTA